MKKIAIIQICQETNGFNPVLTTRSDFESFGVGLGADVLTKFGNTGEIAGFFEGIKHWPEPAKPIGIVRAMAWPGGKLSVETKAWLIHMLREQLHRNGPYDGILFSLHGALQAEDETDVDGNLLETIRTDLGPAIPVVATVDLHAHITRRMLTNANAIVAYHTSPHLDQRQTGLRAAHVLEKILAGARPEYWHVRLPMISISEVQMTASALLAPVWIKLRALERRRKILSTAVFMTQGWLDMPELGWSVLVTSDADPSLAKIMAEELAQMCWERRNAMRAEFRSAPESVALALTCKGKPVIIADGADATNSGAPGDSTHLLREMIAQRIPGGALTFMVDPEAVNYAKTVGTDGSFSFPVGGKRDHIFSSPVKVTGTLKAIKPVRYILSGHGGDNLPIDMGMGAIVQTKDVMLLLVERPGPGSTPMLYRCAGLEPKDFKIVIVKSPSGFRAEYQPFATRIILSDCPGCASPRYAELPFRHINRPLWPLDDIDDWISVPWIYKNNKRESKETCNKAAN